MASFSEFFRYLLGKRSEVKDMGAKDALLAKVVLDIHRLKTGKLNKRVPLFALLPVHGLDRDNSMAVVNERVAALQQHKERLLAAKQLDQSLLHEVIPSVSAIKVVADGEGHYIAFEGNGRLGALVRVFSEADEMLIEVEEYQFKQTQKIVRRLNRVRKANKLC